MLVAQDRDRDRVVHEVGCRTRTANGEGPWRERPARGVVGLTGNRGKDGERIGSADELDREEQCVGSVQR